MLVDNEIARCFALRLGHKTINCKNLCSIYSSQFIKLPTDQREDVHLYVQCTGIHFEAQLWSIRLLLYYMYTVQCTVH
jgi:hypothetical protein